MGEKETETSLPAGRQAGAAQPSVPPAEPSGPRPAEPAGPGPATPSGPSDLAARAQTDSSPEPSEGTIVKSKSNITNNRESGEGDDGDAAETAINNTKSNIKNVIAEAPEPEGNPGNAADEAAINLNSSKSNVT